MKTAPAPTIDKLAKISAQQRRRKACVGFAPDDLDVILAMIRHMQAAVEAGAVEEIHLGVLREDLAKFERIEVTG